MSVLGLNSGYTVKLVPEPSGHILQYIPPLVLIRIQYMPLGLYQQVPILGIVLVDTSNYIPDKEKTEFILCI